MEGLRVGFPAELLIIRMDFRHRPCLLNEKQQKTPKIAASELLSRIETCQVETVSKATRNASVDCAVVKFNFSNPITLPLRSFIKTISSPVSSAIYSSAGLSNQTVRVFPSRS